MECRPTVSVVMPAHNPDPEWFREAVSSVLEQTHREIELIVVDDHSSPPVTDLLHWCADDRVHVVRSDERGVGAARNAGLGVVTGAYVRFADADDLMERDSTSKLVTLAAGDHVVAYGKTLRTQPDLTPIEVMGSDLQGNALQACLLGGFPVRHMSMLFPREAIEGVSWDTTFPACSDWDFVLRVLERAHVRSGDFIATIYRNHPGSISSDDAACRLGTTMVIQRFLERHPELRGGSLHRRAEASLYAGHAEASARRGANRDAARQLRAAARLHRGIAARAGAAVLVAGLRRFVLVAGARAKRGLRAAVTRDA